MAIIINNSNTSNASAAVVASDVCEGIVSLAEFLVPSLHKFLQWDIDSFDPIAPVSTMQCASRLRAHTTNPLLSTHYPFCSC